MSKPYTLGFSPCPNDTFAFYALANGKIADCLFRFNSTLADIETLNKKAFRCELDVTKLSYHAFGYLTDDYVLLNRGSALGRGCGPLLVAMRQYSPRELRAMKIAIPGQFTTAAMLLKLHGEYQNLIEMSFEKIIPAIQNGTVEAGAVIHESRFTYEKAGLVKLVDLGQWWEENTGMPIPLGGIFARRGLPERTLQGIDSCIRESVRYAFANREEPLEYMRRNAQEMDDHVMTEHTRLYVNSFTLELGDEGRKAVDCLLRMGYDKGIFKAYRKDFILK